ncbi:hypothetical protein [Jannaschia sp. R86511]|uniref:antitoxin VbhA family protein n=1 Tax=Jannaschia sp. R86511 TaxID=3093853 RepID=UPI0036D231B5
MGPDGVIDGDDGVARRRAFVDEARHSTVLEGGLTSPAARALQERYVAGDFDVDQLGEEIRRRLAQRLAERPAQGGG